MRIRVRRGILSPFKAENAVGKSEAQIACARTHNGFEPLMGKTRDLLPWAVNYPGRGWANPVCATQLLLEASRQRREDRPVFLFSKRP